MADNDDRHQEQTGGRRKASPGTPPRQPAKGLRRLVAIDRLRHGTLRQERGNDG